MAKEKSFLSGSILSGMFESDEGIYISGYGSKHQMKKQEGEAFDSSSLDVQIEHSCDGARVVDCVRDRGEGEVELCDSKDSIVERTAKTSMDRESFLSNEYYDSDIILMESDSKLDITIGPYEAYEDTPLGCKATFEAFIGVWDDEATGQLKLFGNHFTGFGEKSSIGRRRNLFGKEICNGALEAYLESPSF